MPEKNSMFNLTGKVVAITGGAGVLGSTIACGLAENGAAVAILDKNTELDAAIKKRLDDSGNNYQVYSCDVLDKELLRILLTKITGDFGKIDVLINGAGGNHPKATTSEELSFFDIPAEAFDWVTKLNLSGTVLPSQVFGKYFAERNAGTILNISSMNAFRPLTRIAAYSAAKAAVSNFTQWLAVHMAQEYSPNIRVNAIAPGFFMTKQNEFLLTDKKSGALTVRGKTIIDHTPMQRFGDPKDLTGTVIWLISDASQFVTGIVVPVDGGFSAYSGV